MEPSVEPVDWDRQGNRHRKRIAELLKIAETVDRVGSGKMAASIWIGQDLISIGINKMKTHPLQAKFNSNPSRLFLHAETSAISRAVKTTTDFRKAFLYVARSKNGVGGQVQGMAKPCDGCVSCATSFGLRGIFYCTDEDVQYLEL